MNIGIMLPDLSYTQLNYCAINNVNQTLLEHPSYDCTIFYEDISPEVVKAQCACMSISEIWSFNGAIFATNLNQAHSLIKSVNNTKKFFYVWDLEWLRGKNDYLRNMDIYRHPEIELIARSEHHKQIIEDYTNRKVVGIMSDFQLNTLLPELSTK